MNLVACLVLAIIVAGCELRSTHVYPVTDENGAMRTLPQQTYTAIVERQEVLANTLALGLHSLGNCEAWDRDCAKRWCLVQDALNWECHRTSTNVGTNERLHEMRDGEYHEYALTSMGMPEFKDSSMASIGPLAALRWWSLRAREFVHDMRRAADGPMSGRRPLR